MAKDRLIQRHVEPGQVWVVLTPNSVVITLHADPFGWIVFDVISEQIRISPSLMFPSNCPSIFWERVT